MMEGEPLRRTDMDFVAKVKQAVNQGLEASRDFLDRASDKAKDLGEKGVLKLEILQFQHDAEKKIAELGTIVYEALAKDGKNTVSKRTAGVKTLIQEIDSLMKQIGEKEEQLKQIDVKKIPK